MIGIDRYSFQFGRINGDARVDVCKTSCWRMGLALDGESAALDSGNDCDRFRYILWCFWREHARRRKAGFL